MATHEELLEQLRTTHDRDVDAHMHAHMNI